MKKFIALVLAVLMIAVVAVGCGGNSSSATTSEAAKTSEAAATTSEAASSAAASTEAASSAAASSTIDKSEYSLAVCMPSFNHPVHRQVQIGFIKEAETLGYKTPEIIGTDTADQAEMITSAETWSAGVTSGKAAMLLWTGDHGTDALAKKLGDLGIYVGCPHFRVFKNDDNDKKELPDGVTFELACDPVAYGKAVADLAADALTGKTGSFAITLNTKNTTENAADASFRAEWKAITADKKLEGIKVLDTQLEGGEVESATTINLGIIQANKDILGAFGTTGNSPVTWADAASKAGYKDGELWIAGMDATSTNIEYLQAKKVQVIVAQPLVPEAAKTADYFDTLFNGGTVPTWTDLTAGIVTLTSTGENSLDTWAQYAKDVEAYFKDK